VWIPAFLLSLAMALGRMYSQGDFVSWKGMYHIYLSRDKKLNEVSASQPERTVFRLGCADPYKPISLLA